MANTRITQGVIKPNEDYDVRHINATGVITATNLNLSGVLTYEDVTNVDSIGVITARKGIVSSGVVTATAFHGDGSALTGIDATALKDSSGNVKIQAQASGAVHTGFSTMQNLRVTGIATFGSGSTTIDNNVINVGTALTLGHTQGLQFHTQNLHSDGFEINNINASGIITAAQFSGDGSNLANLPAGLGTALSSTQSSPLNKIYYTNTVLPVESTVTVDTPASASAAYTQYADISVGTGADLIISDGDDLIPDVLGLRPDGTFGGGSLGRMRVDKLVGKNANSAVNVEKGLVVTGVVTATSFVGDGSGLTGAGPTLTNGADNRVVTTTSASAITGEANLIFDGTKLGIGGNPDVDFHIKSAAPTIRFTDTDTNRFSQIYAVDGNLRFDADNSNAQADTNISFRIDNSERLRIDSTGRLLLNTTTEGHGNADELTISFNNTGVSGGDQGRCGMTIRSGDNTSGVTQNGYIYFSDGTSGGNEYKGVVAYSHSDDSMYFATNETERLRIKSDGNIVHNSTTAFQLAKGTTAQRPSGVDGMIRFNTTLSQTEEYRDGGWKGMSNKSTVQGGTTSTSGGYTIHTFTTSGTLTVAGGSKSGVDYLLVAGGGGGGNSRAGGGGGGGMTVTTGATLAEGSYTITVGAGGGGSTSQGLPGTTGSNSSLGGVASVNGGGGGGGGGGGSDRPGLSGGSGGGGSDGYSGGAGTSGQGSNGGGSSGSSGGGGGGGKGGVGNNGDTDSGNNFVDNNSGGNGGNGGSNNYSGSNQTYGAGGGGGSRDDGPFGYGVHGAGNGGRNNSNVATAGSANRGGGGGGGARLHGSNTSTFYGANGGSGIVIIRYLT